MPARPLLVTDDPVVLDRLLDVTTTDPEPDVAGDAPAAARCWSAASVVLVDSRLLAPLVALRPPRRAGVVVVVPAGADDGRGWPLALTLGAEHLVSLEAADGWLRDWLADAGPRPARARLVAVVGACGGAGASTLAAALARRAVRQGAEAVLVDADPWGGGIDLLVGAEAVAGARWQDLVTASGRVGRGSLLPALPTVDGLPVLAWGRGAASSVPPETFTAVLDGLVAGGDLAVVDVGRASPFAPPVLGRADAVLVVAPARLRAVASAGPLLAELPTGCDARLLVRGDRRQPLDPLDVADALGLPLAGVVPADPRRPADEEDGVAPGERGRSGLARLCARLCAELLGPGVVGRAA